MHLPTPAAVALFVALALALLWAGAATYIAVNLYRVVSAVRRALASDGVVELPDYPSTTPVRVWLVRLSAAQPPPLASPTRPPIVDPARRPRSRRGAPRD